MLELILRIYGKLRLLPIAGTFARKLAPFFKKILIKENEYEKVSNAELLLALGQLQSKYLELEKRIDKHSKENNLIKIQQKLILKTQDVIPEKLRKFSS